MHTPLNKIQAGSVTANGRRRLNMITENSLIFRDKNKIEFTDFQEK